MPTPPHARVPRPRRSPAAPSAPPRRRKLHDPQATRGALRRAGLQLFAARGFEGARVEAIAAAAGVNKAMISYHFGGKAGLYRDVLGSNLAGLAAELQRRVAAGAPVERALGAIVAVLGAGLRRDPALARLLLREMLAGSDRLQHTALPHMRSIFGTLAGVVRRGVGTGRLRRVDPVLTHLWLMGSLVFFFATAEFRERLLAAGQAPWSRAQTPQAERFLKHVQAATLYGLRAVRPGRRRR